MMLLNNQSYFRGKCMYTQKSLKFAPLILAVLFFPVISESAIINFEGLSDGDIVTTQYNSVLFTNTVNLTSGISLNELDFPPFSGINVVSDNGGFMSLQFSSPVTNFSGYFTYSHALTLDGYDASDNQVVTSASLFSNNTATSGSIGSNPNEFISLAYLSGISKITITGDLSGSSFALDDIDYSSTSVPIPESVFLFVFGLSQLLVMPGLKFFKKQL